MLSALEEQQEISSYEFGKMKSFTRMYMEASLNYNQEFLNAMGDVESTIEKC